jgi:hypothetical protein
MASSWETVSPIRKTCSSHLSGPIRFDKCIVDFASIKITTVEEQIPLHLLMNVSCRCEPVSYDRHGGVSLALGMHVRHEGHARQA